MAEETVAIYTRVSTEEQKNEGLSLSAQSSKLNEYCKAKEWKIYKIYTDAGISGKSIKGRKAFQEMMNDAKAKKFSAILITKFDRAFRNVREALNILDELNNLGINFISISENIDTTTAIGKAMFTLISTFAQLERDMTGERVHGIMSYRFDMGLPLTRCPLGYKWSNTKKQMVIDERKAEMVKDIFNMTADGKSYKEICKKHKIAPQSFYNIIRNKVYTGIITFEGKEKVGIHSPIVSKETWEKANEKVGKK